MVDLLPKVNEREFERAADQIKDKFADAGRSSGTKFSEQLSEAMDRSSGSVEKLSGKVRKVKSDIDDVGNAAKKTQDELGALTNFAMGMFDGLGGKAEKFTGILGSVGKGAGVLGALALVGTVAYQAGQQLYQLGQEWDDVGDSIAAKTGAIGDDLNRLTDTFKSTVKEMAVPMSDFGDVFASVAQSFHIDGDALKIFSKNIADLQQLTGEKINIRQLSRTFRVFGVDVEENGVQTLDALAEASRDTGIPFNELISNLNKAGPAAKQFNMGLGETAGLISTFEEAGIAPEKTVQSLTSALRRFADEGREPRQALGETITAIQTLSQIGDEAGAADLASKYFGRDFIPFLEAIKTGVVDVQALNDAIGNTGPTIQELREETSGVQEEWQKLVNTVKVEFAPAAEAVFRSVNSFLEETIELLKAITERKWTVVLDIISPGLGGVVEDIGNALGQGVDPDRHPELPYGWPGTGTPNAQARARAGTRESGGLPTPGTINGIPVDQARAPAGTRESGGLPKDMQAQGFSNNVQAGKVSWQVLDAIAAKHGVKVGSTNRPNSGTSYHNGGRATDYNGSPKALRAFAEEVSALYGPQLAELIFDQKGWAGNVKNGQNTGPFGNVYTMQQAGRHDDHVHIAINAPRFAQGGAVDNIPAWLTAGEHVLTVEDVQAMGGQQAVYEFRRRLHGYEGGGEVDNRWKYDPSKGQLPAPFDVPPGWDMRFPLPKKSNPNDPFYWMRDMGIVGTMGEGNFHPGMVLDTSTTTYTPAAPFWQHGPDSLRYSEILDIGTNHHPKAPNWVWERYRPRGPWLGDDPMYDALTKNRPKGKRFGGAVQRFQTGGAVGNVPDLFKGEPNFKDPLLRSFTSGLAGSGGWAGMVGNFVEMGLDMAAAEQAMRLGLGMPGDDPGRSEHMGSGAAPGPSGRSPATMGGGGFQGLGGAPLAAAQGAASSLDMLAPGSGQAAQVGIQLANRAAAFGGQAIGIGINGVVETLLPNGSPLGDPSRNWLGRLAQGVSGARPAAPPDAGQQTVPMETMDRSAETTHGRGANPGPGNFPGAPLIGTMNVTSPSDSQAIARDINRQINAHGAGSGY